MSLKRPILVQIFTTLNQYQHMLLIAAKRRGYLRWTPEGFDSFCFFCLLTLKGKFLIQTLIKKTILPYSVLNNLEEVFSHFLRRFYFKTI